MYQTGCTFMKIQNFWYSCCVFLNWRINLPCFRVMSVELPVVWEMESFCQLFGEFLNFLNFSKVHIFGASLGGFLAMKFAEFSSSCPRVNSLILCNSFADTSFFNREHLASSFWLCPVKILRNIICKNVYSGGSEDMSIVRSVSFMLNRLNQLSQKQLASRLKLNCAENYVKPHLVNDLPVTLLDVFDVNALTDQVRENLYKCFPESKKAHLKSGGNFPYLSRASDVNLHIQIHLREFANSRYSARKGVPSDYEMKLERSPFKNEERNSAETEESTNQVTSINALVSSLAFTDVTSSNAGLGRFDNSSLPIMDTTQYISVLQENDEPHLENENE